MVGVVQTHGGALQPFQDHPNVRSPPMVVAQITLYNEVMADVRSTTIRPATAADAGTILSFIRALAKYERAPDAVAATE